MCKIFDISLDYLLSDSNTVNEPISNYVLHKNKISNNKVKGDLSQNVGDEKTKSLLERIEYLENTIKLLHQRIEDKEKYIKLLESDRRK
jgi:hypothetical protein